MLAGPLAVANQDSSDLSTNDLARRARLEPHEGFALLYSRVAPALIVWARVHVREGLRARLDPEDVLQETAARAWQRFDDFDPARGPFRGWMFGFARNVLLEALQKVGAGTAMSSTLSTAHSATLPDDSTSITHAVARREALVSFAEHVRALPHEEQRLLLYRGLEERPHDEIAKLLNTSVEAASKRWQRLRERLVAELGEQAFLAA